MNNEPCRARNALLVLALLLLSIPAWAVGWSSVGALEQPRWDGRALVAQGSGGRLEITPLSDAVVRVRFTSAASFQRDHSYAVVQRDFGKPAARAEIAADKTTIVTQTLRVDVQHAPLRVAFRRASGEVVDADDPERGLSFAGPSWRLAKGLPSDAHVYGFGEKNGRLDKRGWALGGYHYVMWNSDTYAYDASTDPLYVSVPFYMIMRQGEAYGVFLDNTYRTTFDVGRERQDLLTFGAVGGDLDYYFIYGPHPKQVVERYTSLTGRIPLPPRWALGYHQCRYSYYPESRVRLLASTFREKRVPADVLWLDIHYLDGFTPFTWDKSRFPDPAKLASDLRAQGFRLITIIDPHPKKEPGSPPYDTGMAGDHFVKRADGSVYEAPVWPSKSDVDPGPSVFPDFTRAATREWWGGLYEDLIETGVAGIWNDMDEPAVFGRADNTMPLDLRHDNEGRPTDHREVHNVYGQQMSRATFEGLLQLRPNSRPFVLTRASFAGGQRYAAVWPGDNTSDWTALRQAVPTLLGLGLSGFSFAGTDIGGFAAEATPELFTRWLQLGVFSPFMRAHTTIGTPDQEPWSYGARHEAVNRRAIELRYELLPHIYNVMRQSAEKGLPAMRPLFLEFPEDARVATLDDQFLFGSDLLVAPVLVEGVVEREVYLPAGEWYDYWTSSRYEGGRSVRVPVTLDSLPLFMRAGAFVFRQPVVQHTDEMPGQPLRVLVAPAASSEAVLYEDDGLSLDYRRGVSLERRFHQTRDDRRVSVEVYAPEGRYRPPTRDLIFEVPLDRAPRGVVLDGAPWPLIDLQASTSSVHGWTYSEGMVTVRAPDTFTPLRLTIER